METSVIDIQQILQEVEDHLKNGIIPFWLNKGYDNQNGGYLTCFDSEGSLGEDTDKYIVTQCRMIWGFSAFYQLYPENKELLFMAEQGVNFLLDHFWDHEHGGWYWKVKRDGTLIDPGKVVYGQSFAIYALSQYYQVTKDPLALEYAEETYNLLQIHCSDTLHGGYYENLEHDWQVSADGFCGGDRKSLDVHMHLLEAFTVLVQCSQKEHHKRKLQEIIDLILKHMINHEDGCGRNQFNREFMPIPAISIRRTWNAERQGSQIIEKPRDTTSYGHNLELVWLLNRAVEVLGLPKHSFYDLTKKIAYHTLKFGLDSELGGVYRDGPHQGPAYITDKEFWQNQEVLVGFLDAYEILRDDKLLTAFLKTWEFSKKYLINWELGEWRQLVDKEGNILIGNLGNPWKACYHSGRSMLEVIQRLEQMLELMSKVEG
ncbi:AGE family epimerase/isomerase [Neobacillus niacini]|uniref:AGE family epimerase/isomerase n=1 Tax=Neobacillus niacini TaxID=86668 RepID=UPI00398387F5